MRLLWPGLCCGSFDGFSSALPCPPVFGIILPDGLIELFFKLSFVLNAVRDVPQFFVQQLPEHHTFLCVLLIADITLILEAALFRRRGEDGGYLICHHRSAVAGGRYQKHPRTEVSQLCTSPHGELFGAWNIPPVRLRSACMSAAFSKMAFSSGEK